MKSSILTPKVFDRLKAMAPKYVKPSVNKNQIAFRGFQIPPPGKINYYGGYERKARWANSRESMELETAVSNPVLWKGWPDAGNIEMKIGTDWIRANQWVRFAWLYKYHGTHVKILRAEKQLEAAIGGRQRMFGSVSHYIESTDRKYRKSLRLNWKRLLEIVPEKETNDPDRAPSQPN